VRAGSSSRRAREQLLERLWGPSFVGDDHVLDVHVANLRHKLGDDPQQPRFVETVRGVGFRYVASS
jgi:two-component system, OmpR family, alkaline phosphatase synthesis response regulator PhoP